MKKDNKLMNPNAPADFLPPLTHGNGARPFRFWCQQVMPLVYDDSLSYYELLCKVVEYLNRVIEETNQLGADVDELHKAFELLQGYVNDYFNNLDVQAEIDVKIDALVTSGYFEGLIEKYIKMYDKSNITLSTIPASDLRVSNILGEYNGKFSIQGSCYNKDTGNCMIVCASLNDSGYEGKFLAVMCKPNFEVISRRLFDLAGSHPNDITYNPVDKKYYITTQLVGKLARFDYCEASLEVFDIPHSHIVVQISYNDSGQFYLMFDFKVWSTTDFMSFTKAWDVPIATNASVPYQYVRYTAYQASEVINGAFISMMWIYGLDYHDSYCRFYVCTVGEEKPIAYDTVMQNTFDEPECLFYDGRVYYLLGYYSNILTRQGVLVNDIGVPKHNWVTYENILTRIYDLNKIPLNSMGYVNLDAAVSPINGEFSAPYVCTADGVGSRKVLTVYRTNGEHFTNFCIDGNWNGWVTFRPPTNNMTVTSLDQIPSNSSGYVTLDAAISPIGVPFGSGYTMFGDRAGTRKFLFMPRLNGDIYTTFYDGTKWSTWFTHRPAIVNTFSSLDAIPANASGYITLVGAISPTGQELSASFTSAGNDRTGGNHRNQITLYRSDGSLNINILTGAGWTGWKTFRPV